MQRGTDTREKDAYKERQITDRKGAIERGTDLERKRKWEKRGH